MKQIRIAYLLLLTFGCTTVTKKEKTEAPVPVVPRIDFSVLQREIGMEVTSEWVGFREKSFDACRFATDLPQLTNCSRAYFVQVGIDLSCRPYDEDQNPTLDEVELTPIGIRELSWQLGETSGKMTTNSLGHGLVQAVTSTSMKTKALRVSTGEDYLLMRAIQATRVVTPASWCK